MVMGSYLITKCDRYFISKCVRFLITKCKSFITKCNSYYKMRHLSHQSLCVGTEITQTQILSLIMLILKNMAGNLYHIFDPEPGILCHK